MKIVVIGAVAAGTSAAAKARRNDDFAEITIYEKDYDISYSGCGLAYYIGGAVKEIGELTPRDSTFFKEKYNIDVATRHEVLSVDPAAKELVVRNFENGETFTDHYDKLVIATGASPFRPNIIGLTSENVFFLRNVRDAVAIKEFINKNAPKRAVVAGTGFIGLEMLESLSVLGIDVAMVEIAEHITPNLDGDMAAYLENQLTDKGIKIIKGSEITAIESNSAILSSGRKLPADIIIMATGLRPNTALARDIGVALGTTGAIKVDDAMRTNIEDVYACGDCIENLSAIMGKPIYCPLGSTANKTGRICGDAMTGGNLRYRGGLGTSIFRVFDLAVASTGLNEKDARALGLDIEVCHNIKPDKPSYFGGEEMVIKAVADRETKLLLGAQIIGTHGVDKRIDVFATLLTYGVKVGDLFHLDLAYSPPFSTTKDPVHYTGMILENAISRGRHLMTAGELRGHKDDYQVIDVRSEKDTKTKGMVDGAVNIPHARLRAELAKLDTQKPVVTYCNKGVTGNATQNILLNRGFSEVYTLSGGHKFYKGSREK